MLVFFDTFKLRESDFDWHDNMKISAYLDIFQTIAARHATVLGLGYEPMLKKGIAWVVTKIRFDCFAPLHPNDTVTVKTLPHPKGLIDYTRDFFMYDENGKLVAKGTSQWVHIDFNSRKIVKPAEEFDGEFADEYAYEAKKIERVLPVKTPPVYSEVISRSMLDHNRHTNNIKYADIMFNAAELPPSTPKRVIINFVSETKLNDKIDVALQISDGKYVFSGYKNGEVCFNAQIEY